jgi:N-acetylglucosaminyldiphosphoundecaprenol N-acetyl-beta-D-mannosaminyltransferase
LGAREGVAAEAQRRINCKTGRDIVVGVHSPSFGFEQDEAECQRIIDLINQSDANVLAVGVGAPKQEKFIYKYKSRFDNIKIFMAVGATLDFEAGNIQRAPKWVSEMGLEWLYRLLSEPRRLWKRYLVEGPQFFWLAILQKLNLYQDPFREVEASLEKDAQYKPIGKLMDI